MSTKYSQGEYTPVNPGKYIGKYPIAYRSSWELSVFRVLDAHPNVSQWASESITIPYMHPLTGKWTFYIPDLLIVFTDKNGNKRAELVEIKPAKEAYDDRAKSKRDKAVLAVNKAKWAAAMAWCHKNGLTFRVLTEDQLFHTGKK
jgi:hypothetical protein